MALYTAVYAARTQSIRTRKTGQRHCILIVAVPMQVCTGRRPDGLLVCLQSFAQLSQHALISAARRREVAKVSWSWVVLEDMQREVADRNAGRQTREQKRQNTLTKVTTANFSIGHFVMVCLSRGCRHNIASKWVGSMRIIASQSNLVYEFKTLDRDRTETFHVRQILHCPAVNEENYVTDELRELAVFLENAQYLVKDLSDVREKTGCTSC